jgi:hypothetical protein
VRKTDLAIDNGSGTGGLLSLSIQSSRDGWADTESSQYGAMAGVLGLGS